MWGPKSVSDTLVGCTGQLGWVSAPCPGCPDSRVRLLGFLESVPLGHKKVLWRDWPSFLSDPSCGPHQPRPGGPSGGGSNFESSGGGL